MSDDGRNSFDSVEKPDEPIASYGVTHRRNTQEIADQTDDDIDLRPFSNIYPVEEEPAPVVMRNSDTPHHNAPKQQSMTEESEERTSWGKHIEFILASIGFAVGLGNVWRFPYLAYRNGGGAFLIPYVLSLILAGLPIFFLEMSIGQYAGIGANSLFGRMAPIFQGLGWAMVAISALIGLYYNVIIAWAIYYFFASFQKVLPWASCRNDWNTDQCRGKYDDEFCTSKFNGTAAAWLRGECITVGTDGPPVQLCRLANGTMGECHESSAAEEYFYNEVLQISDSFEDVGGIGWKMTLCLLLAWLLVFACLVKGVQSTGKVVYFTATFPYVVLIILFFRGVTLEGAVDGILLYLTPDLSKLGDYQVWSDAASQIFYSLGTAAGGLHTMSSYNPFNNNCLRDAVLVASINCATSIFAGFVVFSIIGYMAFELQVEIHHVVEQGPGLAFVLYPTAIARMPVSQLWSVLFFFMLILLGLGSEFAMVETVNTALADQFPFLGKRKPLLVGGVCLVGFLLGLSMISNGGIYLFTLMDRFSGAFSLLIVGIVEIVVVMCLYGRNRYYKDIEMMLGKGPNIYWKICWLGVCPIFLLVVLIVTIVSFKQDPTRNYEYSALANGVAGIIAALPSAVLLMTMVYKVVKNWRAGKPLSALIQPSPKIDKRRDEYLTNLRKSTAENGNAGFAMPAETEDGKTNRGFTNDDGLTITDGGVTFTVTSQNVLPEKQ